MTTETIVHTFRIVELSDVAEYAPRFIVVCNCGQTDLTSYFYADNAFRSGVSHQRFAQMMAR